MTLISILTYGENSPPSSTPSLHTELSSPICLPDGEDERLDLASLDRTGLAVGWGVTDLVRYERSSCDYEKGMYNTSAISNKLKKIKLK